MTRWILLLTLACTSCSQDEQPQEPPTRPVHTYVVPKAAMQRERNFSGTAKHANETILSFRVSGQIIEHHIKTGEYIKEGQLLARLDPTDYELEMRRLEASLEQSASQLQRTWADFERTRGLYEAQNVSKSILDRDQASYHSARAQHEATMLATQIARKQLEYCTLKAPIAGYLSELDVEAFQTVEAGQPIAKLTQGSDLELEVGIPETLIGQVHIGDPATVTFEATGSKNFPAVVSEVSVTATLSSTYHVSLSILDADSRIRSGMIGRGKMQFADTGINYTTVPPSAIVGAAEKQKYVWVYDKTSQTVTQSHVEVGSLVRSGIVVKKGLKPGQVIVTRGAHHLEEGMRVHPIEDSDSL